MTEPTEKQCTKCLAFKPLGEFHNNKSKKDGKRTECKCCTNESNRQYRAANSEKINEGKRQSRTANPEKHKEYDRKHYAANREKRNQSQRRSKTAVRHARNQCAVINALDPKKWEILQSKLKALDSTKTKEKE